MLTKIAIIKQAANLKASKSELPNSAEVVANLLELEKEFKQEKKAGSLSNLIGCWNLRFITGTKKSQDRAGIVLGAGRYIPQWIKIQISYETEQSSSLNTGRVKNTVKLAFFQLSLSGPLKFIPQKRLLAFDFTSLNLTILGIQIYNGYIRNGSEKEAKFPATEIKHQAFFSYFLIEDNLIAARGRGGGLAFWSREK